MVCVCVCSLRSIENQMKLLSIGSTRRSRSRGRGATSSERGTMRRPTCGTAVARPEASLTLSPHSCVVATSPQWCISSRSTCAWWSVIPASCSDVSSISDSASGSISGGPHRKTCNGVSHMNPECAGGASHLWRVTAVGSVLKAALALRFTSAVIRGSSIGLRFDEPGKLGTALLYEIETARSKHCRRGALLDADSGPRTAPSRAVRRDPSSHGDGRDRGRMHTPHPARLVSHQTKRRYRAQ